MRIQCCFEANICYMMMWIYGHLIWRGSLSHFIKISPLLYILWAKKIRKPFIPLPRAQGAAEGLLISGAWVFSAFYIRETNICAVDQSKISAEAARLLLSSFLRNWITNFPNIGLFALPLFLLISSASFGRTRASHTRRSIMWYIR